MLGNKDEGMAFEITSEEALKAVLSAIFGGDMATEEVGSDIDTEAVWNAYLSRTLDPAMPGATVVISLMIYQTKDAVPGIHPAVQLEALDTLHEVLLMTEPCCQNPWCARTVLFELVQRYNDTFGVPAWVQAAMT